MRSQRLVSSLVLSAALAWTWSATADVVLDLMPGDAITALNRTNLVISGNINLNTSSMPAVALTPTQNLRLTSVECYLQRGNSNSPTVGAELWASTPGGLPDRAAVLESSTGSSAPIPAGVTPLYASLPFAGDHELQSGVTYWIVLRLRTGPTTSTPQVCENTASPVRTNPDYPWRWSSNGFLTASPALSNYGPAVRVNADPVDVCPADFNGDGGIDGADVEAFFVAWEAGSEQADVNSDGGVDGADAEVFFVAWEAGGCP
jgi:hypothetical protein